MVTCTPPADLNANQFPSLGLNIDRSVFPSPSKSARVFADELEVEPVEHTFTIGVIVRLQPPVIDPVSSDIESTIYRLHVPFGSEDPNTDPKVAFPSG